MLQIEGFDAAAHLIDNCHMRGEGYRVLAGIIADHLVGAGLVP